ncbi:MAG: hypothetical protein ABSE48_00870 [Verrucomicrobiota bacterium]
MNTSYLQLLLVVIYLMSGTIGVVLLVGWALKRFGPPKQGGSQPAGREEQKPGSSR